MHGKVRVPVELCLIRTVGVVRCQSHTIVGFPGGPCLDNICDITLIVPRFLDSHGSGCI